MPPGTTIRHLAALAALTAALGCPNTTAWSDGVTQWVIDLAGAGSYYTYRGTDLKIYIYPDEEGTGVSGELLAVYMWYPGYDLGYAFPGDFTGDVSDEAISIRMKLDGPDYYQYGDDDDDDYETPDYCPIHIEGTVDARGNFEGTWALASQQQYSSCIFAHYEENQEGSASGHPL